MAAQFERVSKFQPAGDQPKAIEQLVHGFRDGQTPPMLLGSTGTGTTFTAAHTSSEIGKPTLVLAHNKTLGPQLDQEFRGFLPRRAVRPSSCCCGYCEPE